MSLAVIIPFYYGVPNKFDVLQDTIESIRGEYDELIVIGNNSSDISIAWCLNRGAEATNATHLLFLADDMPLDRGHLRALCHPELVLHPMVNDRKECFGGAVCFPRDVWESAKPWDENYRHGYYVDDDMFRHLKQLGFEQRVTSSVNLLHLHPSQTLIAIDRSGDNFNQENHNYFISKWGDWAPFEAPDDLIHG